MPRFIRSVASASWIDQHQKVAILTPDLPEFFEVSIPEKDGNSDANYTNANSATRDLLVGAAAYRFANFLECFIEVDQSGNITDSGFEDSSRIYCPPSFAGITAIEYETVRTTVASGSNVAFTQLVGARTRSAEVMGLGIGGLGGLSIAETLSSFPPIWTELQLVINWDGTFQGEMLRHSLFPSNCFFRLEMGPSAPEPPLEGPYTQVRRYDAWRGNTTMLRYWYRNGWGDANPWCIPNPGGLDFFTRGGDILQPGGDPYPSQCTKTGSVRGSSNVRKGGTTGPTFKKPSLGMRKKPRWYYPWESLR